MNLIDLISEEEKETIDYFRELAINAATENCGSVSRKMIPVEEWLHYWESAKHKNSLDKVFGESLVLKRNYKWHEDSDTIENLMYEKICRSSDFIALKYAIMEMLKEDDRNDDFLVGYSNSLSKYLMGPSALCDNSYHGPRRTLYFPSGKNFVLSPGSKVMKDLGVLAKQADNIDTFERIRIAHSQILNETSFNCNLCLSIHPLDYITASYNENDWRSCMCWADGDYCRGVIEMMNSPCVVVAYIESNHEEIKINNRLRWNSKKWREFFIVDSHLICGIKGYPYWNRTIEEYCLSWLRELFNPFYHYQEKMRYFNGECEEDGKYININFLCGPAMYNDFCHSDYRMYISESFKDYIVNNDTHYFELNYSGPGECAVCGDIYSEFEEPSDLCCLDCIEKIRCNNCNCVITGDIYEVNGNYYCQDCFEGFNTCECCGNTIGVGEDECDNTIYFVSDEFFSTTEKTNDNLIPVTLDDAIEEAHICLDCLDKKIKLYPDLIAPASYSIERNWWWSNKDFVFAAPITAKPQLTE